MFAKAVAEHFRSKLIRLYVIYDKQIVGPDVSEEHNHEEADTLIPHQVIATVKNNPLKDITVRSPDTDVFMLLLDLVSNDYLDNRTGLKLNLGKGKGRIIDVQERVRVLGKPRCRALVGFHNFTGADWGGKFVGKTKESWTKLFMELSTDDTVLQCFRKLGEGTIQSELADDKLPADWKPLEGFVCKVYSSKGPLSLHSYDGKCFAPKTWKEKCYLQQ